MNTYGDTLTRVRAELVDGYGGQRIRDWANATRKDMAASVQVLNVTEQATGRQVVTTSRRANVGEEILETDRVEWRGNTYEVTGVEEQYMVGRLDHYEVQLSLVSEAAA